MRLHRSHVSLRAGIVLAGIVLASPSSAGETGAHANLKRPGFHTEIADGRLWVFREGSEDLEAFRQHGEPAKIVVRPAAAPGGITIKAPDAETIVEYLNARPGFFVRAHDGRLWVFREGSDELQAGIHMLSISRNLERIADHAVNIAEDVLYLSKGEIQRHNRPPLIH